MSIQADTAAGSTAIPLAITTANSPRSGLRRTLAVTTTQPSIASQWTRNAVRLAKLRKAIHPNFFLLRETQDSARKAASTCAARPAPQQTDRSPRQAGDSAAHHLFGRDPAQIDRWPRGRTIARQRICAVTRPPAEPLDQHRLSAPVHTDDVALTRRKPAPAPPQEDVVTLAQGRKHAAPPDPDQHPAKPPARAHSTG